jgi:hypothetical protein
MVTVQMQIEGQLAKERAKTLGLQELADRNADIDRQLRGGV